MPPPLDTAEISPLEITEEFVRAFISTDYDATLPDTTGPTGGQAVLPQMPLPLWATIADNATKYFINSHQLYADLMKCLSAIESIFDAKCQTAISLAEGDIEDDQPCVSVAIKPSKEQEATMGDHLFECNRKLASSLSLNSLPFIVLTME